MGFPTGRHQLGPDSASLHVKTYRQGVASRVGHDLVIEVTRWQATLAIGEGASVELTVDPSSLEVREGLRGVKPLTDKDRLEIKKTIDEKLLRGAPIAFRSSRLETSGDGGAVTASGELEMAGESRPLAFELAVDPDGRIVGGVTVTQSEWGIKPYSGLMGALKVRDAVDVEFAGRLPVG